MCKNPVVLAVKDCGKGEVQCMGLLSLAYCFIRGSISFGLVGIPVTFVKSWFLPSPWWELSVQCSQGLQSL